MTLQGEKSPDQYHLPMLHGIISFTTANFKLKDHFTKFLKIYQMIFVSHYEVISTHHCEKYCILKRGSHQPFSLNYEHTSLFGVSLYQHYPLQISHINISHEKDILIRNTSLVNTAILHLIWENKTFHISMLSNHSLVPQIGTAYESNAHDLCKTDSIDNWVFSKSSFILPKSK